MDVLWLLLTPFLPRLLPKGAAVPQLRPWVSVGGAPRPMPWDLHPTAIQPASKAHPKRIEPATKVQRTGNEPATKKHPAAVSVDDNEGRSATDGDNDDRTGGP